MFLGIDVGSNTTKGVLYDGKKIVRSAVVKTYASVEKAVNSILSDIVSVEKVDYAVSTGYGRKSVKFADESVTEITAHTAGIYALDMKADLIIDIGGQDTKVINCRFGFVEDFIMNDKCAAGTGRFLEVMAGILNVGVEELGSIALSSSSELSIESTCTVFAESEVISMISNGVSVEDIAYAVHRAVVGNILSLVGRMRKRFENAALSGGVSYNQCIKKLIEDNVGNAVFVPDNPQITGAFGAAVIASYGGMNGYKKEKKEE